MKKVEKVFLLGLIVVLVLGGLIACDDNDDEPQEMTSSPSGGDTVTTLPEVQIREYQGEKLDAIDHFRENSILGPQYVPVDTYTLKVSGLVTTLMEYTYDEILEGFDHYKKVLTLDCVEGWSVKLLWEGILVRELIQNAMPASEADTIIFHAYDGYTTSFPIEYVFDNDILMAYKMNAVTLPPARGYPFQLAAESKWGYKWIKWITEIELSDDENYRGYWESRGYSDSGDLDGPIFD